MKLTCRIFWMSCFIAAFGFAGASSASAQSTLPSDFSVARPTIPDRTFSIADYGAVADGSTLSTDAITKAIDAVDKAGGGTLNFPAGTYLTGPFTLCNNLNLHLEKEAVIRLNYKPEDLKTDRSFQDCIYIKDGHDIAITGPGTIDGHGSFYWRNFFASRSSAPTTQDTDDRPRLIRFMRCSRVLVQDVTLINAPSFHLIPSLCQDVTIENITIKAPVPSPNTDGIDPSGRNFIIRNCSFDTGDDCIAVKGGLRYDPDRPAVENFLITDCSFMRGHGMSIGSETFGGVRNLTVRNCTFDGTEAGIRIKSPRGKGGVLEYVTYEHLKMRNVKNSILITCYYPKIPTDFSLDPAQEVTDTTPQWRHIRIDDVTSTNSQIAGQIVGLPEMPLDDIVLINVHVSASKPIQIAHARGIRFENSKISATRGQPIIVDADVEGLE